MAVQDKTYDSVEEHPLTPDEFQNFLKREVSGVISNRVECQSDALPGRLRSKKSSSRPKCHVTGLCAHDVSTSPTEVCQLTDIQTPKRCATCRYLRASGDQPE